MKDYSKYRDQMLLLAARTALRRTRQTSLIDPNAGSRTSLEEAFPYPLLYGITGPARSGKDTIATLMPGILEYPCKIVKFASPIKKVLKELFEFTDEQLEGDSKDLPDPRYEMQSGKFLTPRHAMQRFGTEFARGCYPNIWVDACMREVLSNARKGVVSIITDLRFDNEAEMVRGLGGKIIKVERPGLQVLPGQHASENGITLPPDAVLVNDGALQDLRHNVLSTLFSLWEHLRGLLALNHRFLLLTKLRRRSRICLPFL